MPWIQISKAEVQQLAHFFCCLLMYFYEVIHLSLNRCVKKTANTEARWCHILHEESLTLCLLSVFKSPSAWFTQKLLKLLFLLGMAFLVNLWLFFFFLWPLPAVVQYKEFIKQYQRYKICSSVAEGIPTPSTGTFPKLQAEQSIWIYQQQSWHLKTGVQCPLQAILTYKTPVWTCWYRNGAINLLSSQASDLLLC